MTELRDVERDLDSFRERLLAAALFVLVCFGLLAARLIYLQVVQHEELSTQAEANRIAIVPVVPNCGLIVDRHGVVLANNYSAYTLEITSSRLTQSLEATIDALSKVLEITPRDRLFIESTLIFPSLGLKNLGSSIMFQGSYNCYQFFVPEGF